MWMRKKARRYACGRHLISRRLMICLPRRRSRLSQFGRWSSTGRKSLVRYLEETGRGNTPRSLIPSKIHPNIEILNSNYPCFKQYKKYNFFVMLNLFLLLYGRFRNKFGMTRCLFAIKYFVFRIFSIYIVFSQSVRSSVRTSCTCRCHYHPVCRSIKDHSVAGAHRR
jgi:hypothetical protein